MKTETPPNGKTDRKAPEQGSALVIVLFSLLLASLLSMALAFNAIYEVRLSRNYNTGSQAFYAAEAGLNHAVKVIQANTLSMNTVLRGADGQSGTSDDGILNGSYIPSGQQIPSSGVSFSDANYRVLCTDGGGGQLVVTATSNGVNNSMARVEARLAETISVNSAANAPGVPGRNTPAALSYVGDMGKKGKLDLHIKQSESDEGDDGDSSGSPIAINGNDRAGGPGIPGVNITDFETFDKITEKIGKKLYEGKLPSNVVTGPPSTLSTIGKPPKTGVASFTNQLSAELSAANLNAIAGSVIVEVNKFITDPNPNKVVISGGTVNKTASENWGTAGCTTCITYVTANELNLNSGANITGHGMLIVSGDMRLNSGSQLNWNGPIFLLGGTDKDAILQNKKGNMTVNGPIMILGTGSSQKKSILKLEDDNNSNQATNTINGSVMILTGSNTDKEEKAEFKAKHGNTTINGFISIVGDKTKLDVHTKDDSSFRVYGGVSLSVPGEDDKDKAKVHLHGQNVLIQYDSSTISAALSSLNQVKNSANNPIINMMSVSGLNVISWREIRD